MTGVGTWSCASSSCSTIVTNVTGQNQNALASDNIAINVDTTPYYQLQVCAQRQIVSFTALPGLQTLHLSTSSTLPLALTATSTTMLCPGRSWSTLFLPTYRGHLWLGSRATTKVGTRVSSWSSGYCAFPCCRHCSWEYLRSETCFNLRTTLRMQPTPPPSPAKTTWPGFTLLASWSRTVSRLIGVTGARWVVATLPCSVRITVGCMAIPYMRRNNWVSIGDPSSAISALSYAGSAWTCGRLGTGPRRHHHGQRYCIELNISPPGQGYGVDASLSDDATITVATQATEDAASIEENYGFSNSPGCTAPHGVFLAEGSTRSCIGYDAAGSIWVTVPDPAVFPGAGITQIDKTSWATKFLSGTDLCSGIPPDGNCN